MKISTLVLSTCMLLVGNACATLDKAEIRNMRHVPFESLRLNPVAEPSELRIDLVRQQTCDQTTGNVTTYQDVPYHPLGFELGNGLFYDLNGNLSLRVDYLLGIKGEQSYKIRKEDISRGDRGIEYYTLHQDSLQKAFGHKERTVELYQRQGNRDSLSISGRWARNYSIVHDDSSVIYRKRRRARDILQKKEDGSYVLDKWLTDREYQLEDNKITLDRHFLIERTNNGRTLLIMGNSLFRRRILYTLERSDDKILVYDNRGAGKMIKLGEETFALYRNRTLLDRYSLQTVP